MMMIMGKNANLNILMQGLSTVLGKLGSEQLGLTITFWGRTVGPRDQPSAAQLSGAQLSMGPICLELIQYKRHKLLTLLMLDWLISQ